MIQEPTREDWEAVRERFATIRRERGLDSVAMSVRAHRSSVDRWAKGVANPQPEPRRRLIAFVEGADLSHLRQVQGR